MIEVKKWSILDSSPVFLPANPQWKISGATARSNLTALM